MWICEKIGRRISYIEGLKAGNEYYLPPEILYEDEKYVIFTENLSKKDEKLFKLIHEVIENVRNNQ
ncbi:MAG: hypothetical protein H0Z24_01135 [Thermosipho sp. (in: Bacteria)]|nr:hypothetical protein [Thermosipho sp. (in: thermotogales)]